MYLGHRSRHVGRQGAADRRRRRRSSASASGAARRLASASRLVGAGSGRLDQGDRRGGRRAARRTHRQGACRRQAASAFPARCMARRCSTPTTRCCAPASCGTIRAATRRRRQLDADPRFRQLTGNIVFPGFTAPKLAWVQEQRAGRSSTRSRKVLLPKDYLRLWLTGEHMSEMSDSAGTSWLDVGEARTGRPSCSPRPASTRRRCPTLVEGTEPAGTLRAELAARLGHGRQRRRRRRRRRQCGLGLRHGHGQRRARPSSRSARRACCLPPTAPICPTRESAVHTFCHALPNTWHQMGVILSATDSLNWLSGDHRQSARPTLTGELGDELQGAGGRHLPALSLGRAHAAQ